MPQVMNIDFLGPLPTGEKLLVVMNQDSGFPEVEIMTTTTAATPIPILNRFFATYGYTLNHRLRQWSTLRQRGTGPIYAGKWQSHQSLVAANKRGTVHETTNESHPDSS